MILGIVIGLVVVLLFFGLGTIVVSKVAKLMPSMALVVALSTYLLQVVLLAVFFVVMKRTEMWHGRVDPKWLAGTVLVGTLLWCLAQTVLVLRSRRPIYDDAAETVSSD